jgi:hypothetical protein
MTFKIKFRLSFLLISGLLILLVSGCSKPDLSTEGKNLVCYAATYSKGVYKSDNGGISWYPLSEGQDDIYLYSKKLFLSPDGKRIYVTTTGGGLFFIDMEKGALNNVTGSRDEDVRSVAFLRTSGGQTNVYEIFVGKRDTGVYKSDELASIWETANKGLTYRDVNVLFNGTGSLFAGTNNGIFKWDNSSKSWSDTSAGIENRNIFSIGAGSDGKTIYAGAGAFQDKKGRFKTIQSLYKSMDDGRTWQISDKGLPNDIMVFSIAVNAQRPERVYLGTSEGVYRSIDSGSKWSRICEGLPKKFRVLDIKVMRQTNNKDLVYAAGVNGLYMAPDEESIQWVSRSYGLDNTYVSCLLPANQ